MACYPLCYIHYGRYVRSFEVAWFAPSCGGDTSRLGVVDLARLPTFEHNRHVLTMVDALGFDNVQMLDNAREELALITGQWPQVRKATKSISNFKLRQGMPIGVRVTLRGDRMWEFLDRLISVSIPRIRDFQGLEPKGFDGSGNFNLGLKEQLIFPEIKTDRVPQQRGMNISFVIGGGKDDLSLDLLRELGMPFKKAQAAKKGNN